MKIVPKVLTQLLEPDHAPIATKTRPQAAPRASLSVTEEKALQNTVLAKAPQIPEYDYVFIGAGATGGTAAADLADDLKMKGFSVLVLEGGVDKQTLTSQIPAEHALASEDKALLADPNRTGEGTGYWVRHYENDEQAKKDPKAREDGKIFKPRGEGFGGSTRMNANVFVRIDDKDWDALALATGDPAFRAENMKPLLQELTKVEYRPVLKLLHKIGDAVGWDALKNLGGHGFEGPIGVTTADPKLLKLDPQLAKIGLKGLWWSLTTLGSPMEKLKRVASMFDPNDDLAQNTEGPVLMPMSVNKDGKRNGARDILLAARDRHPDSLKLQDGARVSRLLLDGDNKCTGLRYTDPQGKEHEIKVKREAIVACGAMESAALLMRSGIGPKAELDKVKDTVEPKVILDGVGKKQGFRYEVGVVVRLKKPLDALTRTKFPVSEDDPAFKQWKDGKGGPLAINGAILSFQSRSRPDLKEPDLFVFAVPGKFEGYEPGYSKEATEDPNLLTFVVLNKNKGESFGTLELDPNNPNGAPLINHHFHSERKIGDSAPLVAGIKQVRDFVQSQIADMVDGEVWPGGDKQSDAALTEMVENGSWDHHPRGGAQLGSASDPSSVVDSDFKVLGTTGLRVIDASVLPNNIGDFIVSGLYQIGKLAADKIAADAAKGPQPSQKFNPLSIRMAEPPKTLPAARALTQESADAAEARHIISDAQHAAMTDGTVSKVDMDAAWAAIDNVLARGEEKGGDNHTLAHNLLLSVAWQLDQQPGWRTKAETIKDRLMGFIPFVRR